MGQAGAFETDDGYTPLSDGAYMRSLEEREFDLRVRMFALDMAVQSLPSLVSVTDNEETKLHTVHRATAEYEKILRGEQSA